jgi:hypothetical protein
MLIFAPEKLIKVIEIVHANFSLSAQRAPGRVEQLIEAALVVSDNPTV